MAGASTTLHEDPEKLRPETIDRHRAFVSLLEELEAADWYDQRVDAATDDELREILAHNRDEEKEHAAMVLEWLRRRDAKLDEHLRTYLFTEGSILEIEDAATAAEAAGESGLGSQEKPQGGSAGSEGSLGIGSLRGTGNLVAGA
jgi:ferritin-like protein